MLKNTPIFYQTWKNLLFLHWSIPEKIIQDKLPPGLTVDTWNDKSYIGIIPFQMKNLRPLVGFSIPKLSNFTEINLRTYVRDKYNRPGVWFFSLDTKNSFGNWIANTFFHLNYRSAEVNFESKTNKHHICKHLLPSNYEYQIYEWEESNTLFSPFKNPQSLEFFLTERYRLFSYSNKKKQLYTGEIFHQPYELNYPILNMYSYKLIEDSGIKNIISSSPESVLSCSGTDVIVYKMNKV